MTAGETPDSCAEPQGPKPSDKDYDLAEPAKLKPAWTAAVARHRQILSEDGATVTLIGDCPRCSHQMSVELPIKPRIRPTILQDGDVTRRGDAKRLRKPFTKVAVCNCGGSHRGRPDDSYSGCGAFGALLVGGSKPEDDQPLSVKGATADQELGPRHVRVIGRPDVAAIHDVAWERAAETEGVQRLASARAAAEKWTQTIASLFGVFSIVLVVKGPEDISKIDKDSKVRLALPDEVPTRLGVIAIVVMVAVVVVVAGVLKWTHAPSWIRWALLIPSGILAVLVGVWVDESWTYFTLVVVLLCAAVVLAATAIITGGLAAFGLPSSYIAASGQILRHRHAKQARLTRSLLRGSLYAATATLAIVGAAIVLTWTHTLPPP